MTFKLALVGRVRWQLSSGAVDGVGVDGVGVDGVSVDGVGVPPQTLIIETNVFRRNFFPIIYYEQVAWNHGMVPP